MHLIALLIAIATGFIILLGYFLPSLAPLQSLLLRWAIILAGAATLAGVFNLLSAHGEKIRRREKHRVYSAVLIISLVGAFLFGMALGPGHQAMRVLLEGIILPAEAALLALLTVTLVYAAMRLLRRRLDLMNAVFVAVAALTLLGSATLPFGEVPVIGTLARPWITDVAALGGARGILIGVALGTLTTGLRILLGADRPYGGG